MDNILETIAAHKKLEVAYKKRAFPVSRLEHMALQQRPALPFDAFIGDEQKTGIIAEFKRRSPVKGMINDTADVSEVTSGYARHGASALSVLTDEDFFSGGSYDFSRARRNEHIPLLRKDFIIDEYQVVETRAMGADVLLLIAAILTPRQVQGLSRLAVSLGLQVLLEVHAAGELGHYCPDVAAVGVNNRDLKAFTIDMQHSVALYPQLPPEALKISESGIRSAADVRLLRQVGYHGFLIGSLFMKEPAPEQAFAHFVKTLES
ncbi:indole-3-glycerol phosphate synthase TrpC [Taibaiella koreensis]|uniref:indole-3-glycerol phosphate synthase TrpC n=1 Tax=Taibaiella koreensis TaxID=1268548 RepID=UPI000E59DC0A|nr:indole-3-glycerol phosphate synthase TrpC [Taibaiella koreensis]